MSVYHATRVRELSATLESIAKQTVSTNELIVILDGPVSDGVHSVLSDFSSLLPIKMKPLPINQGLGPALAEGLCICSYDWIFRIDSDDVYPADRFALQIDYVQRHPNIHALGGHLIEHYVSGKKTSKRTRHAPICSTKLVKYAKWRNPLNHQTVFFNKEAVVSVGGYQDMPFFEDYHLWARLLSSSHIVTNLDQVLAETTVSDDYFRRRGGSTYSKHELRFLKSMVDLGFISRLHGLIFFSIRLVIRKLPVGSRRNFYKLVL